MSNLVITTDSPTDIAPNKAEAYGIGIIPLHVNLDGKDYKDGQSITNQFIMDTYRQKKILPSTSAVAVAEYVDFFGAYLEEGKTVIHISFSSGASCTYQNACIAAEDLKEKGTVHVIDSKALSVGTAVVVYKACDLLASGATEEELLNGIQDYIARVDKTFVITSLEFLKHGGRCSAVEAFGANLLKLKPCIDMVDGKMEVIKKFRGSDEKAYLAYLADRIAEAGSYDDSLACVSSVLVPEATLETVVSVLKEEYHFKEVVLSECGCVIAAHGGKGALALSFLRT